MADLTLSQPTKEAYLQNARRTYSELKRVKPTVDIMQTFVDVALYSGIGEMESILTTSEKTSDRISAFNSLITMSRHLKDRDSAVEEDGIIVDYEEIMGKESNGN